MERQTAIDVLSVAVSREIEEFCIGEAEHRAAYAKARDAFNALGVSDKELGYDESTGGF